MISGETVCDSVLPGKFAQSLVTTDTLGSGNRQNRQFIHRFLLVSEYISYTKRYVLLLTGQFHFSVLFGGTELCLYWSWSELHIWSQEPYFFVPACCGIVKLHQGRLSLEISFIRSFQNAIPFI